MAKSKDERRLGAVERILTKEFPVWNQFAVLSYGLGTRQYTHNFTKQQIHNLRVALVEALGILRSCSDVSNRQLWIWRFHVPASEVDNTTSLLISVLTDLEHRFDLDPVGGNNIDPKLAGKVKHATYCFRTLFRDAYSASSHSQTIGRLK